MYVSTILMHCCILFVYCSIVYFCVLMLYFFAANKDNTCRKVACVCGKADRELE